MCDFLQKLITKLKDLSHFSLKWLLWNALYVVPALIAIIWLITKHEASGCILLLLFVSGIVALSIRNYADRHREGIVHGENTDEQFKTIWGTMPYWEKLHWIAVFGFLAITWIMMALGMEALFIAANFWTVAFVIIFSGLVTYTLFWLVLMIGRKGKHWLWFLVFYVVFDLLSAFTFNYFHIYHNISRTQRVQNCVKYSSNLVAEEVTPIENRKTSKENMKDSRFIDEIKELKQNITKNKEILQKKNSVIKGYNPDGIAIWGQEYNSNTIKQNIRADSTKIAALLDSITRIDTLQVSSVSLSVLDEADSLCKIIQRQTTDFLDKKYGKDKYLSVRDSLVREVGELHAKLQIIGINTAEIDTTVAIICLPEVTHLESIEELFSALNFFKMHNKIEKVKNLWAYMAVSLSCLVDLLPMLLGLFIALSKGENNSVTFKQWWWFSKRQKE